MSACNHVWTGRPDGLVCRDCGVLFRDSPEARGEQARVIQHANAAAARTYANQMNNAAMAQQARYAQQAQAAQGQAAQGMQMRRHYDVEAAQYQQVKAQYEGFVANTAKVAIEALGEAPALKVRIAELEEKLAIELRRGNIYSDKLGALATDLRDAHETIGRQQRTIERLERDAKRGKR